MTLERQLALAWWYKKTCGQQQDIHARSPQSDIHFLVFYENARWIEQAFKRMMNNTK